MDTLIQIFLKNSVPDAAKATILTIQNVRIVSLIITHKKQPTIVSAVFVKEYRYGGKKPDAGNGA